MDDIQITLFGQRELADAELVVSHMQTDLEYHKKLHWSFEIALKKEEKNLKKLQAEYREYCKDQRSKEHENN